MLGVAYKKDIDDLRESPAMDVIRLLQEKGADVQYHDPFCPVIKDDGHTPVHNLPLRSVPLTDAALTEADVVVVVTDHSEVDYARVAQKAAAGGGHARGDARAAAARGGAVAAARSRVGTASGLTDAAAD